MGLQTKMQDSEPDEYKQDIHCNLISPFLLSPKTTQIPGKWTDASQLISLHKPDRIAALKTSLSVLLNWAGISRGEKHWENKPAWTRADSQRQPLIYF